MSMIIDNDKSMESEEKFDLQKARKNALNGQSPRARCHEKKVKCVEWLFRWGFSTSELLTKVSGAKTNFISVLMKSKLVVRTEASGDYCKFYYTLSQQGLELASEHLTKSTNHYKEIDRYRVNQRQLKHDLLAQFYTIEMLKRKVIDDYETERMGYEGEKRPDVVWLKDKNRVGIEIELTTKFNRRKDEFVARCVRDIPNPLAGIIIFTPSEHLQKRYSERFKPGTPFWEWRKDQKGRWIAIDENLEITEETSKRVAIINMNLPQNLKLACVAAAVKEFGF